MAMPTEAPVMVLPGTILLPNSLLPLHIFEERYRQMLEFALQHDRMFCVALMKPGISEANSEDDFYHVAGLGLIRACVGREDGTSDLILQGLVRVQFTGFVNGRPYRVAEIQERPSKVPNLIEAEALGAKVLELCRQLKERGAELPAALEKNLFHISNPDTLSDVVTHSFIRDPIRRQGLLEEVFVAERLRKLIQYLGREVG